MRTVTLRVAALALLLLLILVSAITVRLLNRLPNSIVYFVRAQDAAFTLEGVRRRFDAKTPEARLKAALQALTKGTPEAGLSSAFPPDTEVRGLELRGETLIVDLSSEFAQGGDRALMLGRLNQLFYTLTQPLNVSSVSLRIEGEPVEVLGGEGLLVPQPWVEPGERTLPTW